MTATNRPPLDELMELATPLLREAFDDMPPEQAAVTALGRRIRAEVQRIYSAGRAAAASDIQWRVDGLPFNAPRPYMEGLADAADIAKDGRAKP